MQLNATKSAYVPLVARGVDTYTHVLEFCVLVDHSMAYVQEAFSDFFVVWYHPGSSPPILFPLFQQCDRCLFLLLRWGSWLGDQDLPAMGAVFILELAANSGSSWISQAPNLHFSIFSSC